MGSCNRKSFKRNKICIKDFDKRIDIVSRTLLPVKPGESNPRVDFPVLKSVWSALMTVEGTRRFQGVAIDDRTTHLWHVRYDPDVLGLETNNHFVRFEARLFKILRVNHDNEDREFLIIQSTERGDDVRDAADA